MSNAGYATLEVIPSLRGAQAAITSGLAGGGAAGDAAGRSIGGRLVGGVRTVVKVGAGAIAGVLGTAIYKGFNRLTAIENATAKLTGLGNSADTVKTIMNNALASVKGTAFGLDEAAIVAAGSVAAGIKPGKDLQRTLGLVADTSTIAGTSLSQMGAVFNQVASSNKIQGDTIAQLNDAGIPIVQLLGKTMHKTSDEVTSLASKGKIDFATFQTALEQGLGGAALKSGTTTQGAFKNMNAALGRFGATLLKGVFPLAKEVFGGITVFLDDINTRIGPVVEGLSTRLANGFHTLAPIVAGFYTGLTTSDPSKLTKPLDGFAAKGAQLRQVFVDANTSFHAWLDGVTGDGSAGLSYFEYFAYVTTTFFDGLKGYQDDTGTDRFANGFAVAGVKIRDAYDKTKVVVSGLYALLAHGNVSTAFAAQFNIQPNSPLIAFLLQARKAVADFFTGIAHGDHSKFSADLSSIGTSAKELGPIVLNAFQVFKSVTSVLPSAGDIIHGVAVTMQFLADHASALPPILTALAIGFGAMKVAQAAAQVVSIAELPIKVAQIGAQFALAGALRAAAAAQAESTAAQLAASGAIPPAAARGALAQAAAGVKVIASWVAQGATAVAQGAVSAGAWVASSARTVGALALQGAAFVAQKVVLVAGAVATGIATAAQWALNAALAANPIGLVVLALVALVAGFVIAYKNSQTFRDIVNGAWSAIKTGVSAVIGFLGKAVPAVFQAIKFAFLNFTILGLVISHWSQIQAFIGAAITRILSVIGFLAALPGRVGGWFAGVYTAASSKLGELLAYVAGIPGRILSALGSLGGLLLDAGGNIVSGLIRGISAQAGRLASFVKQFVVDHIPGPVAKALGIASPSKVMAAQAKWIPLGMVQGIESQSAKVDQAMRDLVAIPGMTSLSGPVVTAAASGPAAAAGAEQIPVVINGNVGYDPEEIVRVIAVRRRDAAVARSLRVAL